MNLPGLRAWCAEVGLWWLAAFHVWWIAAALVFFWYGARELLPAWVVTNAGRGDLAAGLLSLVVALWVRPSLRRYTAVHVFGDAGGGVAQRAGVIGQRSCRYRCGAAARDFRLIASHVAWLSAPFGGGELSVRSAVPLCGPDQLPRL
jgi:hypothetical protein